jgi:hypothetical protein
MRFADFYPFYLSKHSNRACRRLHAFATLNFWWLLAGLAAGYLLAWVGHFVFEKNRPATFSQPVFSFFGDWVMWKDMLTGKIRF